MFYSLCSDASRPALGERMRMSVSTADRRCQAAESFAVGLWSHLFSRAKQSPSRPLNPSFARILIGFVTNNEFSVGLFSVVRDALPHKSSPELVVHDSGKLLKRFRSIESRWRHGDVASTMDPVERITNF